MLKNRVQANTLEFDLEGNLERLQRFGRQQYLVGISSAIATDEKRVMGTNKKNGVISG